ncbi:GNAT family N-acetyltransferase [Kitasatospora sp. NPDC054939]
MNLRTRPSTAELVRNWQPGWGLCRGLAPAEEVADGEALEVALGLPGRSREAFALRADEDPASVARLAHRAAAAPDSAWLTVVTRRPEAAREDLGAAGLEPAGAEETLMTAALGDLSGATAPVPGPYRTATRVRPVPGGGMLVECRILHRPGPDGTDGGPGEEAASGMAGVLGANAVAHRIRTHENHRRRGLASAVMAELCTRAAALGAVNGLLIASADGRRLYTALGWTARAAVLSARPAARTTLVAVGPAVGQ